MVDAVEPQDPPPKRIRLEEQRGRLVGGECVVCTATLPEAGGKEVNLERLLNITGLDPCFFTCGRPCSKVLQAGQKEGPKGQRVIENIHAALVPRTGTRLRAGDPVNIVRNDDSPRRKVCDGVGIIQAIDVDANKHTTLKVRYVIGGVVEVGLDEVEPWGEAAQRIQSGTAKADVVPVRLRRTRISAAASPSSTSRSSMDRSVSETASEPAIALSRMQQAILEEAMREVAERTLTVVVQRAEAAEMQTWTVVAGKCRGEV